MKRIEKLLQNNINLLLDCGCGSGDLINKVRKYAKIAVGVDINREVIIFGKKRYKNTLFIIGDAQNLPIKCGLVDVVLLHHTLEHIPNEKQLVNELNFVLKNYGLLIVAVPHKGLFWFLDPLNFKLYFPKLYKKFEFLSQRSQKESNIHKHYSLNMLKNLFQDNFKIKYVGYGGFIFRSFGILFKSILDKFSRIMSLPHPRMLEKFFDYLQGIDLLFNFGRLSSDIEIVFEKCD